MPWPVPPWNDGGRPSCRRRASSSERGTRVERNDPSHEAASRRLAAEALDERGDEAEGAVAEAVAAQRRSDSVPVKESAPGSFTVNQEADVEVGCWPF